jgi:aldehyde dehydrogenase (NAD+)
MAQSSEFDNLLDRLGISESNAGAGNGTWLKEADAPEIESINPANGQPLARVCLATPATYDQVAASAARSFAQWRQMPAPARGEVIRQLGQALRAAKQELGLLVTLEVGKITAEGLGEIQEMIDMCDFAVGLSRQLCGLTLHSERPQHRLYEQWHPLGPVGVITAFNFPAAVWAWNAALAAVCGNTIVWKPSTLAPLVAIAVQKICDRVMAANGLQSVFSLCVGDADPIGHLLCQDPRLPLISATGSCAMGRTVAQTVARRLGRSLLELGGNNAAIVMPSARQELVLRAVLFAAVGTAGQRCTSLRRLFVHRSIASSLIDRLAKAYGSVKIGNPWEPEVLMGPLISEAAVTSMQSALRAAANQGGTLLCGGQRLDRPGSFVAPAIVLAKPGMPIMNEETFAPILYVVAIDSLEEAIGLQNSVAQGLSSALFTDSLSEAEMFLSAVGSDCGIANVNAGTSGAEIGGAFGGEKETGGGREAGSDAWKAYMRRQTCTINWGSDLPLAQGVSFELPDA